MDMNRGVLQLIVKIADTGNFTKAGQALNMTQPAVSRAVSHLEEELGVTLLMRSRRHGVMLTDIGERIVRIFREILDSYEKIEQEIAQEKGLSKGTVRIGAFPVASSYFVPKIIGYISSRYPHIEFTILEGTIAEIEEWIEARQIDVGLTLASDYGFASFSLYREAMYAVMKEDDPLSNQPRIRAADLSGQSIIICKAGYEPPVLEWFSASGEQPQIKYMLHNSTTGLNMIREGLGIAIMSELSLLNRPENIVIRELDPPGFRDIHIAVPSYEDSSIAVKLFIQTALQLFSKHPEDLPVD